MVTILVLSLYMSVQLLKIIIFQTFYLNFTDSMEGLQKQISSERPKAPPNTLLVTVDELTGDESMSTKSKSNKNHSTEKILQEKLGALSQTNQVII